MTRVRIALVVAVVSTVTAGCSAQREAPTAVTQLAAQPPFQPPASQQPASQPQASGLYVVLVDSIPFDCRTPGATIPGPTVLVTGAQGPAAGILVSFNQLSGNGTIEHPSAITDVNGLASAGAWTLGIGVGYNWIRVTAGTGDATRTLDVPVSAAVPAKVVAVYQLQSVDGQSVPLNYGGSFPITGGHYYFGADGTYAFGYEQSGAPAAPATICSGRHYVVGSSTIDFYEPIGSGPDGTFYKLLGGLYSVGTPSGTSLAMKYEDYTDYGAETYTLVSGSVPPPASSSRQTPVRRPVH